MTSNPNPMPASSQSAPVAVGRQAPRRFSVIKFLLAISILPLIVLAGIVAICWYVVSRPAYGPPDAFQGEFTVAPNVRIEIAPSHRSLQEARFDEFTLTPQGAIIVHAQNGIFDLASGHRFSGYTGNEITSMSFIAGGLVVTNAQRQLGSWDDQGFAPMEVADLSPIAAYADASANQLYLVDEHRSGNVGYRLCSLSEGKPLETLCGSPEMITAVARDEVSVVFATGGGLFRLIAPGQPAMLLKLPEDQGIVGIASSGGTLYFSTSTNIYALGRDTAMPLVLGLGGRLQPTPGGLFVLDDNRGRIFRIAIGKGS